MATNLYLRASYRPASARSAIVRFFVHPSIILLLAGTFLDVRAQVERPFDRTEATIYHLKLLLQSAEGEEKGVILNELSSEIFRRDPTAGMVYAERAETIFRETNNAAGLAYSLYLRGICSDVLGETEEGLDYHQEALELHESINDSIGIALTLQGFGSTYETLGRLEESRAEYLKALEILELLGDPIRISSCCTGLGSLEQKMGNPEMAISYLTRAIELVPESPSTLELANALNDLGIVYVNLSDFEKAINLHEEANVHYIALNDHLGQAECLNNIGRAYQWKGDFDKALDYFLEASDEAAITGSMQVRGETLNNVGAVFVSLNDDYTAFEYYEKAAAIFEESNNEAGLAGALNNIAVIHGNNGELEDALRMFEETLEVRLRIGEQVEIANSYLNIGTCLHYLGNPEETEIYYNKAIAIYRKLGNKKYVIFTLNNLARVQETSGNIRQAIKYNDEALELTQETGTLVETKDAAFMSARLHEKLGNYKEALVAYDLYSTTKDSLVNIALVEHTDSVERSYQASQHEKEVELLKNQNRIRDMHLALSKSKVVGHKRTIIGISAVLTLVLAVILILLNGYRRKRRANRKLAIANERLKLSHEKAQQSEKIMEEFLANMSHEIRTPMNAIVGMTHLLSETNPDHQQKQYIEHMQQAGDNLIVILNDILDLSKIEAGRMRFERVPFQLKETVKSCLDTVRFKANEKGIALELKMADDLPEYVEGDPVRLHQILLNLLSNAIKFTHVGYVRLSIHTTPGNPDQLQFTVRDTGIGIEQSQLQSIFESFSQAEPSTTRKFGGTGLGLTIIQHLVQLQQGTIAVESTPGQGTAFKVTLEFPESSAAIFEEVAAPSSVLTMLSKEKLRVLVVDDVNFNQKIAVELIQKLNPENHTHTAGNSAEALQLLEENTYDLALIDLKMPGMSGIELTRLIRESEKLHANIPILGISAEIAIVEKTKCLEAGMNGYLMKPYRPKEFYDAISQVLFMEEGPEPPARGQTQLMDFELLKEITDADHEKLISYIDLFVNASENEIACMQQDYKSKNIDDLHKRAHALKPKAGYMGVNDLEDILGKIEAFDPEHSNYSTLGALIEEARHLIYRVNRKLLNLKTTITP